VTEGLANDEAGLLSISIVTWRFDARLFAQVLADLHSAVRHLERHYQERRATLVRIVVIDNGNDAATIQQLLNASGLASEARVISSGRNLGYGKAHNLAIATTSATYHLIMNPDVLVAQDALLSAVTFLDSCQDAAALSPYASDGNGNTAYLCKRYPALLDLVLRGFAPRGVRSRFSERLDQYESRGLVAQGAIAEVELISGCFMFCRTQALRQTGGFKPAFFLYFEDFSLSLELRKFGRLMYVPNCRIVHYGGNAAKKGLRHALHFIASALKFYNHYGWKLL
jgi:GT2 family glycosyltransferase